MTKMNDVYKENYQLRAENAHLRGDVSRLRDRVTSMERDLAEITPRMTRRRVNVAAFVNAVLTDYPPSGRLALAKEITRFITNEVRDYESAYRYAARGVDLPGVIREAKKDALSTAIKEALPGLKRMEGGMNIFCAIQEILRHETGEGYKGDV